MAGATPLAAQRVSDRAHSGAVCCAVGRTDRGAAVCAGFGLGVACAATVWMLALWLFLSRLGVAHFGAAVLAFSVLWLLVVDPFAVLLVGFWLSYGAVAWLIVAFDSVGIEQNESLNESLKESLNEMSGRRLARWLVGVSGARLNNLSLLPMTLLFFRQVSLLGVGEFHRDSAGVYPAAAVIFECGCVGAVGLGTTGAVDGAHILQSGAVHGLQRIAPLAQQQIWSGRIEWWRKVVAVFCAVFGVGRGGARAVASLGTGVVQTLWRCGGVQRTGDGWPAVDSARLSDSQRGAVAHYRHGCGAGDGGAAANRAAKLAIRRGNCTIQQRRRCGCARDRTAFALYGRAAD